MNEDKKAFNKLLSDSNNEDIKYDPNVGTIKGSIKDWKVCICIYLRINVRIHIRICMINTYVRVLNMIKM
jgi:hypothetical protein